MPNFQSKSSSFSGRFATTHWSVVLAAARPESTQGKKALEILCQTYWFPLYAYLRRRGYDTNKAEDYTQAFFASLLEKHSLRLAEPQRGRFRSFLLAALKHFIANERDRNKAKKRGGNYKVFSLDIEGAESRYSLEPCNKLSAEKLFERSWALTILDRAMARLQSEAVTPKKQMLFDCLKEHLTSSKNTVPYREIASKMNMTESAMKVALHRLRRRCREILRDEIAQTVATEEQINEEIRDLFAALTI